MEYKDYYKILGVDKDATDETIKKRYHILARKYHPDVSTETNAEAKFKEIREAYDVLKNPQKRQAYDQLGKQTGPGFTPPPGWEFHQYSDLGGEPYADTNYAGFSEFFETLFGRGAKTHRDRQHAQRGEDLHSKITISLEEAYQGTQRMLQLQEPELDPHSRQIKLKNRSLKVKIPAGVTSGQQIRLANQGSKGIGNAPNGDLYLEIQLAEHPIFLVKNHDIYLNLPITPWEAALGGKVEAPTLGGIVELTIPPNSQTGKKLRLKGRGLPGKITGDQYITLAIYIPEPKTDNQRELYQKMASEMHYNPRKKLVS